MFKTVTDVNPHENNIKEAFAGQVKYTGNGPVFTKPLVVILFTNRSGSNLFSEYLRNTNYIGGLKEILNSQRFKDIKYTKNFASFPDYFQSEAKPHISQDKFFGVKASSNQLAMLHRWNIPAMFSGMMVFQIVRDDLLDQSISMSIAKQTGKWSSQLTGKPESEVLFDWAEIQRLIERNSEQNVSGKLLMDALMVPSATFRYEEFVVDPKPYIEQALSLLGIEDQTLQIEEPKLKKQANELNMRFRAQFLNELANRVSQATRS